MNSPKYYLQDKSYYHGNYMNWWAKDSKGYTANLDNAHQFTAEEITKMQSRGMRDTDVAWLCSYIDDKSTRCVNTSFCDYEEMKEQESILLSRSDNNGWISVDDELPQENQEVLAVLKLSRLCAIVFLKNGDWYTDNDEKLIGGIDYWQPMPQPPKE